MIALRSLANLALLAVLTVGAWFAFWASLGISLAVARLGYESVFWWLGK